APAARLVGCDALRTYVPRPLLPRSAARADRGCAGPPSRQARAHAARRACDSPCTPMDVPAGVDAREPRNDARERVAGRFELLARIGSGGMGEVFAARELATGR